MKRGSNSNNNSDLLSASERIVAYKRQITEFLQSGKDATPLLKELQKAIEELERAVAPASSIPLALFDNDSLSALEAVVKYFKEEKGLGPTASAKILNRSVKTISTTYSNAVKKLPRPLNTSIDKSKATVLRKAYGRDILSIHIPTQIFSDRKTSMLESLAVYLKDNEGISFKHVALIINRDSKTVWTVYNRAMKKGGGAK